MEKVFGLTRQLDLLQLDLLQQRLVPSCCYMPSSFGCFSFSSSSSTTLVPASSLMMTDSTVQSIQLLCCLASHMLAEDSTRIWLVFDFSRPQRWIWLVNHASQLTLRWVEQRNRRSSTWDQQFRILLCARVTMWRPRVCIVHGVQKGSGS